MEKLENVLRGRTTNIQTAFQITIRAIGFRRLSMFFYQGLHKEKETSLLSLCMAHFGSTATSLFEIYTPAWSSASTSRFHKGICFLSWQNFFLLSFFLFLLRSLFRSWFFHKQRASTCEFYKVHDVNRIWKLHENRALTWAVAATIDSPRIFSQVRKKGTFLIYQLLFENIFLELTRLLLKVSEYFFKKTLRWTFEFSLVKYLKKLDFFGLWRW